MIKTPMQMSPVIKSVALAVLILALPFFWIEASSADYAFSTILVPGSPNMFATEALAINKAGQVAGNSGAGAKGFVYTNGNFSTFKVPFADAYGISVQGINDAGEVVGYYTSSSGSHGFLKKNNDFRTIDVPEGTETSAHGINDREQIVGSFLNRRSIGRGFILSGGIFKIVEPPNSLDSTRRDYMNIHPYAINNAGHMAGYVDYFNPGIAHSGFFYANGSFTIIEVAGAKETIAQGINDRDQIVGYFKMTESYHGFLYENGSFTTIDVPGARETWAQGINDAGRIVGSFGGAVERQGFIATRH